MSNEQFRKAPRFFTSFLLTVLAVLTLFCNLDVITDSFREAYASLTSGDKCGAEYINGPRAMVADNLRPEDSLCFISSGDVREKSAENAVIQTVNWQIMPQSLDVLPLEETESLANSGKYNAVLSPSFNTESAQWLSATDIKYEKKDERGGRTLWKQRNDSFNTEYKCESAKREAGGLIPVAAVIISGALAGGASGILVASICFSLFIMGSAIFNLPHYIIIFETLASCAAPWFLCRSRHREDNRIATLSVFLGVFAVFTFLTLAHTFTTPYGLAITGGRAKLWFLLSEKAGGFVRQGFFSNPSWKILEPAYPPGCTTITLGCYLTAGICGEWLTQLIGCAFLAVTAGFIIRECESLTQKLWMLSLFFVPAALTAGGQFYPEPVMTLCVLVGWNRIRNGKSDWLSWLILFAAGWFKNEGLVFAIAAWTAWRIAGGKTHAQIRHLAAGLILPVSWHIFCRICGGTLNDYAPVWQMFFKRGANAFAEILKVIFTRPWHHAFAYPAAIVFATYRKWKVGNVPAGFLAALIFTGISLLAFACIYACSTADFDWHISTSLSRLLWTPALILAYEMVTSKQI